LQGETKEEEEKEEMVAVSVLTNLSTKEATLQEQRHWRINQSRNTTLTDHY